MKENKHQIALFGSGNVNSNNNNNINSNGSERPPTVKSLVRCRWFFESFNFSTNIQHRSAVNFVLRLQLPAAPKITTTAPCMNHGRKKRKKKKQEKRENKPCRRRKIPNGIYMYDSFKHRIQITLYGKKNITVVYIYSIHHCIYVVSSRIDRLRFPTKMISCLIFVSEQI